MKLIMLIKDGTTIPETVVEKIGRNNIWWVKTTKFFPEEESEYQYIENSINGFLETDRLIMIAKFSGNENIAKKLGDERSEMIVYINGKDKEEQNKTMLELVNKLYKETV